MKVKAVIFFLFSCYLFFTMGFRLKAHFCGEELSAVKIVWTGDKSAMCGCGEEEDEEDGCCRNIHHQLRVDQHQNDGIKYYPSAQVISSLFVSSAVSPCFKNFFSVSSFENTLKYPPPLIPQQNIIATSVLLI